MRAAVRASPRSTTFVALAHALCDYGQLDEAEAVCLQGLIHHPDLPTGQVALARAWLEAGKTAQAEMRLIDTIRQHPHHADAYRYLAKVMDVTGRRSEAIAMLTRTRSEIVWTQDLALLLESLTGGPLPVEDLQVEPEVTRLTQPRGLDRRTVERRHQTDRRRGEEARSSPSVSSTVRLDDVSLREYAAAPATPPPAARSLVDTATPIERSHTPTGSFPPIATEGPVPAPLLSTGSRLSTRWVLILAIPALAVVILGVMGARGGRSHADRDRQLASAPPAPDSTEASGSSASATAQVRADMEADLAAGTLQRLLQARDAGRRLLADQKSGERAQFDNDSGRLTLGFVIGLLALDYGVPVDKVEAQRLMGDPAERSTGAAAANGAAWLAAQAAAKALLALAEGDPLASAQAVRTGLADAPDDRRVLLAAIATRYRSGDVAGAAALLDRQPRLAEIWGAGRPTLAALQIDRGRADAAWAVLRPASASGSNDALILLLIEEARRADGNRARPGAAPLSVPAVSAERIAKACARDQALSITVRAACLLNQAVTLRLAGDRGAALASARQVAALNSTNPRILGALAQLLANLGEIDEAAAQAEKGSHLASAAFPPLAWANVAIAIGRGGPASPPAGIQPGGSESRLVSARASEPGGPFPAAGASDPDPDLRWLSSLGLLGANHRQVIKFVESLETRSDRSPVTAYVAGMLASKAGRRHLAARWLAEALTGHGDTCRAAQQYGIVLRKLKQTERIAAVQAALAEHNSRCPIE
jgi:tetratricopeptide (TPR) repeat protein